MLKNRWYAILESKEVGQRKPIGVARLGEPLVLWRPGSEELGCLLDTCPHRGAALSSGTLHEGCITCPFHGFRFEASGRCQRIPVHGAETSVPDSYRAQARVVCEEHGWIWLWYGAPQDQYPGVPYFPQLDETFTHQSFQTEWPAHYTRVIENQLDYAHLPFVHRFTIGARLKPQMQIATQVEGDRFRAWLSDHQGGQDQYIEFLAPNVWLNKIGQGLYIVAAFVPIDKQRTRIYLRFYQNRIRLPVIRDLFNAGMNLANRVILGQDKRVVITQRPSVVTPELKELLVPSDGLIRAYRTLLANDGPSARP